MLSSALPDSAMEQLNPGKELLLAGVYVYVEVFDPAEIRKV